MAGGPPAADDIRARRAGRGGDAPVPAAGSGPRGGGPPRGRGGAPGGGVRADPPLTGGAPPPHRWDAVPAGGVGGPQGGSHPTSEGGTPPYQGTLGSQVQRSA